MSREAFQWLGIVILAVLAVIVAWRLFKYAARDDDFAEPAVFLGVLLGIIGIANLIGAWGWAGDLFFESQYPAPAVEESQ